MGGGLTGEMVGGMGGEVAGGAGEAPVATPVVAAVEAGASTVSQAVPQLPNPSH